MPKPRAKLTSRVFGAGVPIAGVPKEGEAQPNPRWVHIANEGVYEGYPGGNADITRSMLDEMVANFKADPRYRQGPTGLGEGKVVPFDVAHVSEMDPRIGDPLENEKAAAWCLDVQLRTGADGKAQLWGYAKLGDEIKAAIENGEITYLSIAFTPSARDPHTGKPIGALMTSVAFTNKPFIRELTPLAASIGYFGPAGDRDCAIASLRSLLGLPVLSTPDTILQHLNVIVAGLANGDEPAGVDADEILGAVKQILGVPVALPIDQVLSQVRQILQPPDGATGEASMKALERLAKLFSINLAATDAEEALVTEAERTVEMAGKLKDILTAAGFANVAELVKSVPELVKAREKLSSMQSELDTALKALAGFQQIENDAEVSAVMSAHAMPEKARAALTLSLKTDREQFRKDYPLPDQTRAHLLSTFAAGKGGKQVETPTTLTIKERAGNGDEIDLRSFSGNVAQRCIAFMTKQDATFAKLPWGEQVKRAGMFRQENQSRIVM